MQNKIAKFGVAFSFFIVLVISPSFITKKDHCDRQKLLELAIPKLKKFTFIQDYPFQFKNKKKSGPIEYSKNLVTLNRGIRYRFFAVRNPDFEGQPVVSIYNNEKMEVMFATSYNRYLQKFYDEIEFECKTTGNYYLCFSFLDGVAGCGLGVFSSNVVD